MREKAAAKSRLSAWGRRFDFCAVLLLMIIVVNSVTQIIGQLWPFEKWVLRKYFVIQLVHLVNVSRVRDELACPHLP